MISPNKYISEFYEIRGDGQLKLKRFVAKLSTTNSKEIPPITELDIFDLPSLQLVAKGADSLLAEHAQWAINAIILRNKN